MSSPSQEAQQTEIAALHAEMAELRARLEDADEAIRAISRGEVDALVSDVSGKPQLFVLQTADVESNRFHSEILSLVNDAVIAFDDEQHLTYMNVAAETQYSVAASEALGHHVSFLYQTDWQGRDGERETEESLHSTGRWRGESLHVKRNGTILHVESSVSRMTDTHGSPTGYLHVIRDISARRASESSVRESEERYRTLFNSIDEGFCIIEMIFDMEGNPTDYRFLRVNPSFEKHTGLANATGRLMREMVPEHDQHWFDLYGKVALTGEPVRCEIAGKALGRDFDLYAVRTGNPEDHHVAVVFTDITDRKRAEEQLRNNTDLFSVIIDQAPGGVYVADENLDTLQVSERARTMFSAAEPVMGRNVSEVMKILWGPVAGAELTSIFRRTLVTGERYVSPRFTETRADIGGQESYEWVAQRITLPSGKHGVVCYFTDVTEQQLLEDALRKHADDLAIADRRKDEFLAMLAHELRNPLAPMLPGVDVLLQCPDKREVVDQIGNMLKRQVDQMSHLIDDLLDVSRITTGKIELQKSDVSVAEIVGNAIESVQPLIQKCRHELVASQVPDSLMIHADSHRLAQVISNLLSNAAKYTPPGGRIELSVESQPDGILEISVKDNGKGISPANHAKVFDLFDQGSNGHKDGLGIGLTLVKTLVGMHQGTITLISEGEGKGSEFIVELPGVRAAQPVSMNASEPAKSRDKIRVLIADDGKPTADILAMFFQLEGMETTVAYDGEQAVAAASNGVAPDLVCLDLGMPKIDGYEAARRIRELHENAYIVALSGWGSEEDRRKTSEAGFNEHLTKPVKPADLRELMSRVFPG